jgi:hypothetical protein
VGVSTQEEVATTEDKSAHSLKCFPLLGSALRLACAFRTFLSGLTTMIGTGDRLRQYFETLPIPGAPSAAPQVWIIPLWPLVPTTTDSGRYNAISRSILSVTFPAINSITTDIWESSGVNAARERGKGFHRLVTICVSRNRKRRWMYAPVQHTYRGVRHL